MCFDNIVCEISVYIACGTSMKWFSKLILTKFVIEVCACINVFTLRGFAAHICAHTHTNASERS